MTQEYIDIKNISHRVQHQVRPSEDKASRERLMEELLLALTRPVKHASA